jgi:16S rRNA (adenine1518-N6/adenine1519-N6)-dimethyltransferase
MTYPRKRFGQHFLNQPAIAERIVARAGLNADSVVLEIGPGRGSLTRLLAPRCRRLLLVEVDRDLADRLRADFAGQPSVEVIVGDVAIDLAQLVANQRVTVVANLPYNISTPVMMQLLQYPELFDRLVLAATRGRRAHLRAVGRQGIRRLVGRRAGRRRRTSPACADRVHPQPK